MEEGKKKALESALSGLSKKFGNGCVMRLNGSSVLGIKAIPTGSILDIPIGVF